MPQKKNTKNLILQQAILLFSQYGYEAVSMRQIASSVGIKGGSIYNHFSSKYEIMECIVAYFDEILSQYTFQVDNIPELLKEESAAQILRRLMIIYPADMVETILHLYRILYSEQYRDPQIKDFFYTKILMRSQRHIAQVLNTLVDLQQIPPCNTDMIASIWIRTLAAIGLEATHKLGNRSTTIETDYQNTGSFLISLCLGRPLLPQEYVTGASVG